MARFGRRYPFQSVHTADPTLTPTYPYRGGTTGIVAGDSATTIVINKPTGTQSGDLLLSGITTDTGATSITPPSGWTAITTSTGSSGVKLWTYYKIAGGSEPTTYTWTFNAAVTGAMNCMRFVGVNQTNPFESFANTNGVGSTTAVSPAKTTTTNGNNLTVMMTGVRCDGGGATTINMPNTLNWNAPSDANRSAVQSFGFPSVVAAAYKVNPFTARPQVTTNIACEFGMTTLSFNMAYKEIIELDATGSAFNAGFTDLNNWTIGQTSAFPGLGPTNSGDGKLDYIDPTFAPTSGGVFSADLATHSPFWSADLATTERSANAFMLQPGDTVTATITVNSDQGCWPALWTWNPNPNFGNSEIDLFEYHSDNPHLLELSNHVRPAVAYVDSLVTAGTPFTLSVYMGINSVRWYVNGAMVFDDNQGVGDAWSAYLICNMSVSDGTSGHPAPSGGQTHMEFTVTGLNVLRGSTTVEATGINSTGNTSAETSSATDNNSVVVSLTSTDTGTGVESNGLVTNALIAADTASGTEANTLAASITTPDTGSGLDSQSNPKLSAATDTGSGAEATTIAVAESGADIVQASAVEATSISVSIAQADTFAASEANTLTVNITSADTASALDASVSIRVSAADAATGAENSITGLATSDAATGADTNTALHAAMTSTDTAATVSENTSLVESATSADTGTFAETSLVSVSRSDGDTGTFNDTYTVSVPVAGSDTATSSENAIVQIGILSADTASFVETAQIGVSTTDAGNGADVGTSGTTLTNADTGAFAEFNFVTATSSSADTGSFDDEGTGGLVGFEFGTFVDTEAYSVIVTTGDAGAFSETSSTGLVDSDTASAVEALSLGVKPATDTVASVEATTIRATFSQAETGIFVDAYTIRAIFNDSDVITSGETYIVNFAVSDDDSAILLDAESLSSVSLISSDTFGTLESVINIKLAAADTATAVDTESGGDNLNSADTGAFSETAAIGIKQADTATSTDNNIIRISSSDTALAVDASGNTGIKSPETISAVEVASIRLTSNDTALFTDTSKNIGLIQADSFALVSETTSVLFFGITKTDADFGTFSESAFLSITSADTASLADNALIKVSFTTDVLSASEAQSFTNSGISKLSADTASAVENWSVHLIVGDTATGHDNHKIGVHTNDDWDPGEDATISFTLADEAEAVEALTLISAPAAEQNDQVIFVESASIRLLNIGATPRLRPLTNSLAPIQPYYLRQRQRWAVDNERQRHLQALYLYGEWTMFVLMWHFEDYENHLVDHCHRCFGAPGVGQTRAQRIVSAYNNVDESKCPDCFGTTFEGGFKAIIVRPAIFSDTDENQQYGSHGLAEPGELSMESTPDFRVRSGDYTFRASGDRYRLRVPERVTLRTGFGMPYQRLDAIGYNHAKAAIEDETAVAYSVPPGKADLRTILNVAPSEAPVDFSPFEILRSPLIPLEGDQG